MMPYFIADALLAAACGMLSLAVWVWLGKPRDPPLDRMLRLVGVFFLALAVVHARTAWTAWAPADGVKWAAAGVGLLAAVWVWRCLPGLKALPSSTHLLAINQELAEVLDKHALAERELRKLSMALECSSSMVVITDTEGRIEYCNPAFCQCSGYAPQEVLGQKTSLLQSGFTDPSIYRDLWQNISQGRSWQGEFLDRRKNGDLYWSMVYIAPVRDGDRISNFVAVSHDISELKNSEETIRRLAFYDPLTELPNRALFKERLEQTALRARRDQRMFALMYLDLDRFKNINDTLGHVVGDKLLVEVGRRLRQQLRGTDTVARLGGDEFAIILSDLGTPGYAASVGHSLCEALSRPFIIDGHELFLSASIGISLYPDDHTDLEQLICMADSALYSAKDAGRDQFAYYSEAASPLSLERLALEMDLRHAVERRELSVHYLPKVDLADGRLMGLEALLRWQHPQLGTVPPSRFLAVAEETGLSASLGEWLLREVCRQIKDWREAGFGWPVALNLSARQYRDKNLLAGLDAILAEAGIIGEGLEFEIPEAAVMGYPEQAASVLAGLKRRGARLSIDDFGTACSSLSCIRRFRVDALKIDRSFIGESATDPDSVSVVRAVIALAHSLGLKVVAEGVETRAQFELLRQEGCDEAQGYFFSRPLPPEEVLARFHGPGAEPFFWGDVCPVACE